MTVTATSCGSPGMPTASVRYADHSAVLMPCIARVASAGQGRPASSARPRRTTSHSCSESISTPSRSKTTACTSPAIPPPHALPVLSGRLDEANDVTIGIFPSRNQFAATDVSDLLLRLRTGVEERLRAGLDVVHVPVADRAGDPVAVAVGIQAHMLPGDVEADVVGLVHGRPHAQQLAVQGLGRFEVFHRVDDRLDAAGHGELLRRHLLGARPGRALGVVDGAPGAVWAAGGRPRVVFSFTVTGGKIVAIDLLADSERLAQLRLEILND